MIEVLKHIFDFAKDKSTSVGLKSGLVISIIAILIISDYHFNFSYNYYLNNKTEQLVSINNLKKIYESDSIKTKELTDIESKIFERTHYFELIDNLDFSLPEFNFFKKSENIDETNINNTVIEKPTRSLFWMILSSNSFFILLIFALLVLPFTGSVHREIKNIMGSIAGMIVLIGVISLITWIAYKIPLIYNKPYLNYILNLILHSPLLYFLYASSKKDKN